jgi:hypothetical protein
MVESEPELGLGYEFLSSELIGELPHAGLRPRRPAQKKTTWPNTRRCSTTSAYSPTNPPAQPGCPLSSHPTTSGLERSRLPSRMDPTPSDCTARSRGKQVEGLSQQHGKQSNDRTGAGFESRPQACRQHRGDEEKVVVPDLPPKRTVCDAPSPPWLCQKHRCRAASGQAVGRAADAFPHLRAMHRDRGIDLEA